MTRTDSTMKRKYETSFRNEGQSETRCDASRDDDVAFSDTDEEDLVTIADKLEKQVRCDVCNKTYGNTAQLVRHKLSHYSVVTCELCSKRFTRRDSLAYHNLKIHGIKKRKKTKPTRCHLCLKNFSSSYNLKRHLSSVHKTGKKDHSFTCRHCSHVFEDYSSLFTHVVEHHPLKQTGGRRETRSKSLDMTATNNAGRDSSVTSDHRTREKQTSTANGRTHDNPVKESEVSHANDQFSNVTDESALQASVQNRIISPRSDERYDLLPFLANAKSRIIAFLKSRTQSQGGIKWSLSVQIELHRNDSEGNVTTASPYFRSKTYISLTVDAFDEHNLHEALQKIHASMEKYMREGSGWFVGKILKLEIHTVVYRPIAGSAHIPLPKSLAKSNSLLNIENVDDCCFAYCVLASLHPTNNEPKSAEQYKQFMNELNMEGIRYPVSLKQIDKFERQNVNISVNVFAYEDKEIVPLRITSNLHRLHHVNLLWMTCVDNSHYCLIKDLNAFLYRSKSNNSKTFFCPYCLHGFVRDDLLQSHLPYCSTNGPQKVELPTKGIDEILTFRAYEKELKVPYVIYADFEAITRKISTCAPNPECASTTKINRLEVCGFGYKVVCSDSRYTKDSVVYRGKDASHKFIECLLKEQEEIEDILNRVEPMIIDENCANSISTATQCVICKEVFNSYDQIYDRKVKHHNHLTGEFIGVAHNNCNLKCKQAKHTCVVFHNLKKFDAHIICQSIGLFKEEKLTCIAQTTENYISFSLGNLRFIDSLQFLPASLESLVENLKCDGVEAFSHFRSEFSCPEEADLLLRKGVYPYSYMDSFEKFDETQLPPIHSFYSELSRTRISEEDYEHAKNVFSRFNLQSLGSYHDLYLKTDVLLLADVFEAFRNLCMNKYGLDSCHFYTSPGFSWASCLKMTGVQLELLTDIDHILFVEKGIRGGISQISNRYKCANNPQLDNWESDVPNSFLLLLDFNNLYGHGMIQPLPTSNFRFLNVKEIEKLDIMTVPPDNEIGYILEVSLRYPERLHDDHNDYPLAPERRQIQDELLSPYAKWLWKKLHGKSENDELPPRAECEKLVSSLYDKEQYILHYRNLQLYLELGMELKEVHRVLEFNQEPWMKRYIEFNTEQRKQAKSIFEQNYYKLLNNAVFGKTMENVRKHKHIELVHTQKRLRKLSAKPTFKTATILNKELTAVELTSAKVKLNKPSYCGMCILDLSKLAMYNFYYNILKKQFGDKMQLQMTDTDSFLVHIETEDVYQSMKECIDLYDTSNYPHDHFLYSDLNKKKLGKMKDETNGVPISKFVGLRPKMYSFICGGKEEKKAKGIAKAVVKKDFRFEQYKNVLFEEEQQCASMTVIRSHSHELFCDTVTKIGLSSFDDKRYLVNAVESYAYGHYKVERTRELECSSFHIENCKVTPVSLVP